MIVVDVEVYRNYFLALFKDLGSGKYRSFEMFDGRALDIVSLKRVMVSDTTISFNGLGYDLIILSAAIDGADCSKLKDLSDEIIKSNFPAWRVARDQGVNVQPWDHIDVINVAPGQVSLKIYGGRMHARTMQDLPIKPDELISPEQRTDLKTYCKNDVDTTEMLYRKLEGVIDLRKKMSKQYALDLRSKSDAQMAEAIIKHELEALTGKSYKAQKVDPGSVVRYASPGIVWFEQQNLKDIYWRILKSGFVIRTNGSLRMPEWLSKTKIRIGETDYQMGIGGLHSCESKRAVVAAEGEALADFDVASYYPSIILKLELSPDKMGKDFLRVYQSIVTRRLEAKREMQRLEKEIKLLEKVGIEEKVAKLRAEHSHHKIQADGFKLSVNGTFGKLGSMYSALYAPQLLLQVTLTGQLCLLMLIERLEAAGCRVVSANTDGIVVLFKKTQERVVDEVCFEWMMDTSFELERADYRALYSRDVNNYIAVKRDGSTKRKGVFAEPGLMKNPEFTIVSEAVATYLATAKPIEETVRLCRDITKFVAIRRVDGGGVWRGQYLGKAVRFYYSTGVRQDEHIAYAKNKNKVARSDGARPAMTLAEEFPADVHHERYVAMAREALRDMGVTDA
jgi:hypothetical protein